MLGRIELLVDRVLPKGSVKLEPRIEHAVEWRGENGSEVENKLMAAVYTVFSEMTLS
jgi:hypothetical protein